MSLETCRAGFFRGLLISGLLATTTWAQGIDPAAQQQMSAIAAVKANLNPAQQKMDSNLVFAAMAARNDVSVSAFQGAISPAAVDSAGMTTVDIAGNVTPALLSAIAAAGGTVRSQSAQFGLVHAAVPLSAVEGLAALADMYARSGAAAAGAYQRVRGILSWPCATAALSGTRHLCRLALASTSWALSPRRVISRTPPTSWSPIRGSTARGVTVGVLSDSATAARIAALIATGDLPAGTHSLAGQDGSGEDEGTAMMEIVHDMAPWRQSDLRQRRL